MEPGAEFERLVEALWALRHRLELISFRSTVAKLVMASDDRSFVNLATDELEAACTKLRAAEQAVAARLGRVATAWGQPAEHVTLDSLADDAPPRWRQPLREHRDAYRAMLRELEYLTLENKQLAAGGLNNVRESLLMLVDGDEAPLYDNTGGVTIDDRPKVDQLL